MIGQNIRVLRLGILPLVLFFVLFFLCPVLHFLWASVISGDGARAGFTFQHYAEALTSENVRSSLKTTLALSLATGCGSLVLGYLLAYQVVRRSRFVARLIFVAAVGSLFTSTIARALGWRVILAYEGPLNKALVALGILSEPIQLINNFAAVAIGMIHIQVPIVMLGLIPVIEAIPRDIERAAIGLGASRWSTFIQVHLPLTWMNAVPVGLIAVMATASYFTTPVLLGGGRVEVIAIQIQQAAQILFDFGFAAALSVLLVTMIGLIAFAILLFTHWRRRVGSRRYA